MTYTNIILLLLSFFILYSSTVCSQSRPENPDTFKLDIKRKGDTLFSSFKYQAEGKRGVWDSTSKQISAIFKKISAGTKSGKPDSTKSINSTPPNTFPKNLFSTHLNKDSVHNIRDSFRRKISQTTTQWRTKLDSQKIYKSLMKDVSRNFNRIINIKPDSTFKILSPSISFPSLFNPKPIINLKNGWNSYFFNYRSNIDTPFNEKNIYQHNSYGNISLTIAGVPFHLNYIFRRSNSSFFRDINDIQLQFDPVQYRNLFLEKLCGQLQQQVKIPGESILQTRIKLNLDRLNAVNAWLKEPLTLQKLVEYKELLSIPKFSYSPELPDSVNNRRADSTKVVAAEFVRLYEFRKKEATLLKSNSDSLETLYKNLKTVADFQKNAFGDLNLKGGVGTSSPNLKSILPPKFRWLLHLKKFGIGRNQLNHSELTTKNMSLTGVNFEYNSWYYIAFAAGTVDYRFRDFAISNTKRMPQYMTMLRLGIGDLGKSYIIATVYRGRKQFFATAVSNTGIMAIDITGFSLDCKWSINRNSYLQAEVAESISPDFRKTPVEISKFNLNDKSNKALALRYQLYIPATFSRIEAKYKFTGANFQSFSSFQTNSETVSWSVKADQYLIKRKLRIALALKKNEFSNPYIEQAYTNNTVFKSVQVTFRAKKFPVISAGFSPISQITSVDSHFVENMFYSFNGSLNHTYKIGLRQAITAVIYNRFYNNYQDTGFVYFRAQNIFFTQSIAFSKYNLNAAVSHSSNPGFKLTVFDAGVQFNIKAKNTIGFGVKVNDYSGGQSKTGFYGTLQLELKKWGILNLQYNKVFVPGNKKQLVENEIMNMGFTMRF